SAPAASAARASVIVTSGRRRRAVETSPNWRSRSTSTTGAPVARARKVAALVATNVFPHPPEAEATMTTRPRPPPGPPSRPSRARVSRVARASVSRRSPSSPWSGTTSQAPTWTISARSAFGRSWRASTIETHGWRWWREARRRSPVRCMSDGPATRTSQCPAARWCPALAVSGQGFTTARGATALWRMRAASSGVRSTTSTLGSEALTASSRRQPQSVARVPEGGDVRATQLHTQRLEGQRQGGVEAGEDAVDGRDHQVGEGREVDAQAEQRDVGAADAQEPAQPEGARADGLGVAGPELARIVERRGRVGRRGLGPGGDVQLGQAE